ncbi:hypothetical protein D6783_00550 [Candidatus Woesearchaeota archaeon]|nr:MAG: hypothetical protein D6783_00550 [Candidatus Woesearchaeota archaeon]
MQAVIEAIIQETQAVRRFRLRPEKPLEHRPGQFCLLSLPESNVARPYSIATSPTEEQGFFELIIKRVEHGRLTPALFAKKEGDVVDVKGPFGTFYYRDGVYAPVVLIGGGSGIAPLRSILHYLLAKKVKVPIWLFFGNRTEQDIILHNEFSALSSEHENFSYIPVVDHPKDGSWQGYAGHVTESLVAERVVDLRAPHYYLCGPPGMVAQIICALEVHGVPHEHIRREQW